MNLFLIVFGLFALPPNSMSKLIDNFCTCKFIKTAAAYVYVHQQLHLCCYVLVCYFEVCDIHLCKLLYYNNYSPQAQLTLVGSC